MVGAQANKGAFRGTGKRMALWAAGACEGGSSRAPIKASGATNVVGQHCAHGVAGVRHERVRGAACGQP